MINSRYKTNYKFFTTNNSKDDLASIPSEIAEDEWAEITKYQ